jgi:hypothetical protein
MRSLGTQTSDRPLRAWFGAICRLVYFVINSTVQAPGYPLLQKTTKAIPGRLDLIVARCLII